MVGVGVERIHTIKNEAASYGNVDGLTEVNAEALAKCMHSAAVTLAG